MTESVLIATESVITYRRRRRTGVDAVVELLLIDPANPRAVGYQLDRLRSDIDRIPGPADGPEDGPADDSVAVLAGIERRLAAAHPSTLARRDPDGTRSDLQLLTVGLAEDLRRFARALEGGRFAAEAPPRPLGALGPIAVGAR